MDKKGVFIGKTRGRPAKERLSMRLAAEFRDVVRRQMASKGIKHAALLEARPAAKPNCSELPMQNQRWLSRALSQTEDLKIETGIELAMRLDRVGVSLPNALLLKVVVEFSQSRPALSRPALILFPGESQSLARMVVERVQALAPGIGKQKATELGRAFGRDFKQYERFSHSEEGRHIVNYIINYLKKTTAPVRKPALRALEQHFQPTVKAARRTAKVLPSSR